MIRGSAYFILFFSVAAVSDAQIIGFIPETDSLFLTGGGCLRAGIRISVDSTNPVVDTLRLEGWFNVDHFNMGPQPDSTFRYYCFVPVGDTLNRFAYDAWFEGGLPPHRVREAVPLDQWYTPPLGVGTLILRGKENGLAVDSLRVDIIVQFIVAVQPDDPEVPDVPVLAQNFPNPFNAQTYVQYFLHSASHVRLSLVAITGQEVAVLLDREDAAGYHKYLLNARNLPSGTYVLRLLTSGHVRSVFCQLIK